MRLAKNGEERRAFVNVVPMLDGMEGWFVLAECRVQHGRTMGLLSIVCYVRTELQPAVEHKSTICVGILERMGGGGE